MKRNWFVILIIVIVILLVGVGIYFFSSDEKVSEEDIDTDDSFLFPFGDSGDTKRESTDRDGKVSRTEALGDFIPKLRKISPRPSTKGVFVQKDDGLYIRYTERETGHLFEVSTGDSNQKRLTNTTIPRIYNAEWSSGGESIVLQYLGEDSETIQSFAAEIEVSEESGEKKLTGIFLSLDIKQLNFFGNQMFTLVETESGSIGTISDSKGESKNQIFSSPLREWLVEWPGSGTIALTTKPSSGMGGFMYFLNTKSESLKKILSGITNLTTLTSPDLSKVLYSSGTSLFVYDIGSDESTLVPINTLSEKCVWGESPVIYCGVSKVLPKNLPESWYQGLVTLSDDIWKINVETNQTDLLVDPEEEYGVSIDLTDLVLDEEESYLLFVNKKDSTLWVFELKEKTEEGES